MASFTEPLSLGAQDPWGLKTKAAAIARCGPRRVKMPGEKIQVKYATSPGMKKSTGIIW
jgi:hypothetical protein